MITQELQYRRTSSGRPILPQPNTSFENALLILAVVGVLVGILVLATTWAQLPAIVPTHFGIDGKPNAYGDKTTFLAVPIFSVVIVTLLSWLGGKPHLFNYPWKITEENASRQYHAARVLMRVLAFIVAWLFAYITYATTQSALNATLNLNLVFLLASMVSVFGAIIIYIVLAVRLR